jgi:hypothetical protein
MDAALEDESKEKGDLELDFDLENELQEKEDLFDGSAAGDEQVEFAVFSPERIAPKSFFVLDVWAYFPHQYSYIIQIAKTLGRENVLGRKLGVPVKRGAFLTITTEIHGLDVHEPIGKINWNGSPTNASFIVNVPEGVKVGSYPGKVFIGYQGITIAKIVFLITIASEASSDYTDHSEKIIYPRTAFASYASENRAQILARIQGMKKIAPNLDVFIDVFSLRSGQNWLNKLEEHVPTKDIFYLFWSKPAACSVWVEREWKLALQRRGMDYIDPVPLEDPENAPPPRKLSSLHFNDAYLAYITYENSKRQ